MNWLNAEYLDYSNGVYSSFNRVNCRNPCKTKSDYYDVQCKAWLNYSTPRRFPFSILEMRRYATGHKLSFNWGSPQLLSRRRKKKCLRFKYQIKGNKDFRFYNLVYHIDKQNGVILSQLIHNIIYNLLISNVVVRNVPKYLVTQSDPCEIVIYLLCNNIYINSL